MSKTPLRARRSALLSIIALTLGVAAGLPCAGCDSSTAAVRSISVNPASPVVIRGSTDQMTAVGVIPDGTSTDITDIVTWSSSNTSVATVSNDGYSVGVVVGISPGTVTISARLNGLTGSTQIQVR